MQDKNRNQHRKSKLMLQAGLDQEQQETLAIVKERRGIHSNADLVRTLLDEEKQRLDTISPLKWAQKNSQKEKRYEDLFLRWPVRADHE